MKNWNKYRKVLCVRPDNLGDVLMTYPAIKALKDNLQERHIALLTSSSGAATAKYLPDIDEVIAFDLPWIKTGEGAGGKAVTKLLNKLSNEEYDAAVIFTTYSQNPLPSAMLCYLANIPNVLGYCRENPYFLMNHWVPDKEPFEYVRHEVERQLSLVAQVGAKTKNNSLVFNVPSSAMARVRGMLDKHGMSGRGWIVMHTSVSEDKRRYPAGDFVAVGRRLVKEKGLRIVMTGSAEEHSYVQDIKTAIGPSAINLAGQLDLGELGALIKQAPLLLSNNTGPVHIASAVGTPVVVVYAKTNPQHTPWQIPSKVLYFEVPKPLRSRNQLLQTFPGPSEPVATVDAVVEAVNQLMEEKDEADRRPYSNLQPNAAAGLNT